ncbi:preprotein translocase subunit SecE [Neisseria bacilliformis]|jgi:preprotein translocase, secE subunit|uniref:preprotein translocase subunit SecE n=1 Tax=Neisseria bacilliformis TaxID=267212 RepID=UPI001EFA180F|nr:preprotein translocase subunit SecE [Neisseria bacilliformis]
MSKQEPEGKVVTGMIANDRLQQQVRQVRKSAVSVAIRMIFVLLVIAGVVSLFQYRPDIPSYMQNIIIAASVILIMVICVWGNFYRLVRYIRESITELKKVVWPEKSYTIRMTGFVLVFVAILATFIYGVDTMVSWVLFDLLMR